MADDQKEDLRVQFDRRSKLKSLGSEVSKDAGQPANPTVKRKVPGKKNGRRNGCVTEERQLARLARKGKAARSNANHLA